MAKTLLGKEAPRFIRRKFHLLSIKMSRTFLHPALIQLLQYQSLGKLRRAGRGFATPRKLVLSLIGAFLAILWLGNAAFSVFARQPLAPGTLQHFIPVVLLLYCLWHLLKVVYRQPEEGIQWTPAERDLVCARPFHRRDLLAYRFASIAMPGLLKSLCFVVLMLPDLPLPLVSLVGVFLTLLFLDLMRMAFEITACGLSKRMFSRIRGLILLVAFTALVSVVAMATLSPWTGNEASQFGLLRHTLICASELRETWIGMTLEAPFRAFGNVITATCLSYALAGWMILTGSLVMASAAFVLRLDTHFQKAIALRERLDYNKLGPAASRSHLRREVSSSLPWVPHLGGVGAIAWRQVLGAGRYLFSLLLALAAPAILSCLPLLIIHDAKQATLNVVGALTFYSFLLLPSALKFDFRRDVDRMFVLKGLPIRPLAVVLGQLATPVLIASLLQLAVIAVTAFLWPSQLFILVVAFGLLVTLNILIYAMENILFLFYPHRLKQEGIEVFLRATLTFSAKGILFAVGIAAVLLWAICCKSLAQISNIAVWLPGGDHLLPASSVTAIHILQAAFRRFDPAQDVPA